MMNAIATIIIHSSLWRSSFSRMDVVLTAHRAASSLIAVRLRIVVRECAVRAVGRTRTRVGQGMEVQHMVPPARMHMTNDDAGQGKGEQ